MSDNPNFNATGATFTMNLDSDNAAFCETPKGEVIRLLKNVIEKIENGDEFSDLYDINGNIVGDWCIDVSGEEWPTEQEAINQFEAILNEEGTSIDQARDFDHDELNQRWANWVDINISDEKFPTEATNWDYE